MATRRYGISQGQTFVNVAESVGLATVANNIELTVDLAAIPAGSKGREEVLKAIEYLEAYIMKGNWPPA